MTSLAASTSAVDAASAAGTARILLRVSDRASQAWYVPLAAQRVLVGRAEDADVPLNSGKVSRHHAELFKDPFDRWWVRDLGSRNGTRVNGARVSESILQPGDVMEIGEFALSLSPAMPAIDQTSVTGSIQGSQASHARRPPHRLHLREDDSAANQIRPLRELETPKIGAANLMALTEFGHRLNTTQDAGERLRALGELMLSTEFHGRTAVVLRAPRAEPERAEVIWGPASAGGGGSGTGTGTGEHAVAPPVSRGVLRAVCKTPEPVMATNLSSSRTAANVNVELSIPAEVMALTVIAAPLRFDEQTIELIYVVLDPDYSHSDWLALAALAVKHYQQAETVWLNVGKIRQYAAVERELEKAQEIQMHLIPRQTAIPGLALAIGFRPCHWVAGDYADVLPMADGRTLIAVADVCGKGLSAALVASSVHTMVHANARAGKDLLSLMHELNQYLLEDLGGNSFVTMLAIAIDRQSGAYQCINSGHPPALVFARDGATRELQACENAPLGVDPDPPKAQSGQIAPGELLALFTDGLTELLNPAEDMLGLDGLSKALQEIYRTQPDSPLPALADRLTAFLDDYQRGAMAADDRTFLLARLEQPP
jgi:serine phosphatase RsbU (regulator of sigma subunit)